MSRQLGKRPAQPDARIPSLSKLLAPRLVAAPDNSNWYAEVGDWPMMMNDRLGCCVEASVGHIIQQRTSYAGKPVVLDDGSIVVLYTAVGGYDPSKTDPATGENPTDQGTLLSAMMAYWATTGVALPGGGVDKVSGIAVVDHVTTSWLKAAVYKFGSVLLGAALPVEAQAFDFIWDYPDGQDWQPASWGGHCVNVVGYETTALGVEFDVITWGGRVRWTERFATAFADEAYAVLDKDDLDARDVDPAGIAWADLETAMNSLRAVA